MIEDVVSGSKVMIKYIRNLEKDSIFGHSQEFVFMI